MLGGEASPAASIDLVALHLLFPFGLSLFPSIFLSPFFSLLVAVLLSIFRWREYIILVR